MVVNRVRPDTERVNVFNTDEAGAEQHILRRGLLWSGMGGLLIAISVGVLLFR